MVKVLVVILAMVGCYGTMAWFAPSLLKSTFQVAGTTIAYWWCGVGAFGLLAYRAK